MQSKILELHKKHTLSTTFDSKLSLSLMLNYKPLIEYKKIIDFYQKWVFVSQPM